MKLHILIETNRATGTVTVPFCSDSYNAALKRAKELALLWWAQKTDKYGRFPWLAGALDDLVDSERTCRIEVPLENTKICLSANNGKIELRESGAPGVDWVIRKVENIELSSTAMAEVSDNYDYTLIRTNVLYSLQNRFPGLNETTKSVQALIDSLTCDARENISNGCDEDWSVDEAFRKMADEVRRVCEGEE